MALGFGFNKTKVLSSAEKYVQQGKLQNAIAEYEKIIKEDPKDLTVLNTIGDLYARVGQTDQAVSYFKKVGDTYASEGFTVKAIAMYKKLTKLSPTAIECVQKLAELYTNQGLYNDARAQYMQVADSYRRSGSLDQAARIFEKMLELDPENASMQSKLADLYVSIGKKDEAKNIYFRAAESLRQRNALDAADEALGRVLAIEANNARAIEMRGQIAMEAGDAATAAKYFEQLPDVDSRPNALRALLQSYLQQNSFTEAEPIARKLLTVHNDAEAIRTYAETLISAGKVTEAVQLYDQFADRLLSGSSNALDKLHAAISRVREDAQALDLLRKLFIKAGDTTHTAEVMELLAHASAQAGDFERARDLYRELADLEPENPLHAQNYKQILTRLGEDSTARPLTVEEASQAFMVEELEPVETVLEQEYPEAVSIAIKAALTEAELFASYNVPAKAIPPLESVIDRAPEDVRLNQMLASLYARVNRFAEASRCCTVLQKVYAEAGHDTEAAQFADMAARYASKAGIAVEELPPAPSVAPSPTATAAARPEVHEAVPAEWADFQIDFGPAEDTAFSIEPVAEIPVASAEQTAAAAVTEFTFESVSAELPEAAEPMQSPSPAPTETALPASAQAASVTHEFDLSDEWESVISGAAAPAPQGEVQVFEFSTDGSEQVFDVAPAPAAPLDGEPVAFETPAPPAVETPLLASDAQATADPAQEVIEEACFYIAQSMYSEANAAIEKLASQWPDHSALPRLRQQLPPTDNAAEVVLPVEPANDAPVLAIDTKPSEPSVSEFVFDSAALIDAPLPAAADAPVEASVFEVPLALEDELAAPPQQEAVETPTVAVVAEPAALLEEIFAAPATAPAAEPILDLPEEPLADIPVPVTAAPVTPEPPSIAASADVLGDFVLDLEESLGDDFSIGAPAKTSARASAPAVAAEPIPAPVAAFASQSAAAASVSAALAPTATVTAEAELPATHEVNSVLADMFAEFKEDVEEGTETGEDPDTHYNLGVAFKEMGLLDEAIGELQKVAQAIERGHEFSQTMQAYTWLASCLVEKGVPEAAFKWYDRALKLAPDEETRTAIHYEFACAQELAGDKRQALSHFMEVYGSNIDYRDVAERIKALKS